MRGLRFCSREWGNLHEGWKLTPWADSPNRAIRSRWRVPPGSCGFSIRWISPAVFLAPRHRPGAAETPLWRCSIHPEGQRASRRVLAGDLSPPSSAQNGSPTTVIGPPTSGARVLNEFWRDALGGEWVCTVAGTPETWIQIRLAAVTADPSTGTIPTGYPILNVTAGHIKRHTSGTCGRCRRRREGATLGGEADGRAGRGHPGCGNLRLSDHQRSVHSSRCLGFQ